LFVVLFLVEDCETVIPSLAPDQDLVGFELCLEDIRGIMELRHLRYFVAVAEEGLAMGNCGQSGIVQVELYNTR
jgi:hypothetical protein